MFNPKKILKYFSGLLLKTALLIGTLFVLGLVTELCALYMNGDDPFSVWPLCLLLGSPRSPTTWDLWLAVLVLRDMLPGLLISFLVLRLAGDFVKSLYGLASVGDGAGFLWRCLFGRPSFKPYLRLMEGAIEGDKNHVLRQVGGPGGLVIYTDGAAVLEKAGRITRVVGPGLQDIHPFEKVWDVVDLRPQQWPYRVNAMSKEGIPVTCVAEVGFRIDDGGREPTDEMPYPYDEDAIFKAAACKWIREAWRTEPDRLMIWTKRVIMAEAEGNLRSILARYPLDELIEPATRNLIRNQLEEQLHKSEPKLGVKILQVALGDIVLEDKVTQQWIEKWKAKGQRRIMGQEAKGKVKRILITEEARTIAQIRVLVNVARVFKEIARYGKEIPSRLVLLRFIDMISQLSAEGFYLPTDMIETMNKLQEKCKGI